MRLCMLHKLHYGQVAAGGMLDLTPRHGVNRPLNSQECGVPRSRTNYHKYYFRHTTKEWNSLPKKIATVPGRVWIRLEDCYLCNGRLAYHYHYHYHYHFLLICFTEPLQESSVVKDSLLFSVTRSKEPLQG